MDITIRNDSPEPPYKQIVSRIELMMVTGKLTADTQLPTLSELSESLGVSPETVKKAYSVLKGKGKVYAMQGVGYFVCGGERRRKKILMLIDRLDSYKVQIQRGLSDALGNGEELTILLHNQDVDAFISLLESTSGMYDSYIVAPHFRLDRNRTSRLVSALSRIPAEKLIIIDRKIPEMEGNFGEIVQAYRNDAATSILELRERLERYSKAIIISPAGGLYCREISEGLVEALSTLPMTIENTGHYDSSMMELKTLFIVLGRTSGEVPFSILRDCERLGLKLGVAVGLVTYNDEAANEFICGGITCLSTDFYRMGYEAGMMVRSGKNSKLCNPFTIKLRNSL